MKTNYTHQPDKAYEKPYMEPEQVVIQGYEMPWSKDVVSSDNSSEAFRFIPGLTDPEEIVTYMIKWCGTPVEEIIAAYPEGIEESPHWQETLDMLNDPNRSVLKDLEIDLENMTSTQIETPKGNLMLWEYSTLVQSWQYNDATGYINTYDQSAPAM